MPLILLEYSCDLINLSLFKGCLDSSMASLIIRRNEDFVETVSTYLSLYFKTLNDINCTITKVNNTGTLDFKVKVLFNMIL